MTGTELRALLRQHDISQRELARQLEMDQRTIRYYCAGKPMPRVVQLAIAHVLGLRVL
jgi:transcriptional regulator with XRE-family HTH domain